MNDFIERGPHEVHKRSIVSEREQRRKLQGQVF